MSSRVEILGRVKEKFGGSVKISLHMLFTLIQNGHYQAATDVLPEVRQAVEDFKEDMEKEIDLQITQDNYHKSSRSLAEVEVQLAKTPEEAEEAEEPAETPEPQEPEKSEE